MKQKFLFTLLLLITTLFSNATELKRSGWNLISVCQDMDRSEIDMNGIEEIQSQDGKSIYTGDWEEYSNLDSLQGGYGYWIKGDVGVDFDSGVSSGKLVGSLNRDGWNLMASCEYIPSFDINLTEWNIQEIQSQEGKSIYSGDWAEYSNLDGLENGYGYWVKGDTGTSWISKRGLSIPSGFEYQTINNSGEVIETTFEDLIVKLFVDYNETANDQANHTGIVVKINGQDAPLMQIQDTYRGHPIVVGVYNLDGELVGISDTVTVATEGAGTIIDVQLDDSPPPPNDIHPRIYIWEEAVVPVNENQSFWFEAMNVDVVRLADGTPNFITLVKDNRTDEMMSPSYSKQRHLTQKVAKNSSASMSEFSTYRIDINATSSTEIGYYAIELIGTNSDLGEEVRDQFNLFYGIEVPSIELEKSDIQLNQGESQSIAFTLSNADTVTIGRVSIEEGIQEESSFVSINSNRVEIQVPLDQTVGWYLVELLVSDSSTGGVVSRWIYVEINPEGSNHRPNIVEINILHRELAVDSTTEVIARVIATDADGDAITYGIDNEMYESPSFIVINSSGEVLFQPDGTESTGYYGIGIYVEDIHGDREYAWIGVELIDANPPSSNGFTDEKVVDRTFYMDRWYDELNKGSVLSSLSFNSDYTYMSHWYRASLDDTSWEQSGEYYSPWRIDTNGSLIVQEDHNITVHAWSDQDADGSWYSCDLTREYDLLNEFDDRYEVNASDNIFNCTEIDDPRDSVAKVNINLSNKTQTITEGYRSLSITSTSSSDEPFSCICDWITSLEFTQPQPLTKDDLRLQGYEDVSIGAGIELIDGNNTTLPIPTNTQVHIAHTWDDWHPALGLNGYVYDNGDFNASAFLNVRDRYRDGQMMNYQVYIDSNQNALLDEGEEVLCSESVLFEDITSNFVCNTSGGGGEEPPSISQRELPLIIVRVEFNDYHFGNSASVWHSKIYGNSEGELNHYYNEISYGNFQFKEANETDGTSNDGIITVTLNENHPGDVDAFIDRLNSAVAIADNYIDFSAYDKNSNGSISKDELQIMYLVAGGESATGVSPGVWAHAWCMYGGNAEAPTHDGVKIMSCGDGGGYSRFGEKHFALDGPDASMGIIAHELGHAALNLPDLYDYDGSSEGIGNFGLMGGGSWGKKPGDDYPGETPVHMTGWSKIASGFAVPEVIDSDTINLNIRGASYSDYNFYKIYTGVADEYFLIENRAPSGYDMGLSSLAGTDSFTGGLSILHIDNTQEYNTDDNHRIVDIEEANNAGLDNHTDRGHINNLFFSGNSDSFTPTTTPNSNTNDGATTGISITNISEAGSTMSVDIDLN